MDWSTLRVVDLIEQIRMSAGTLSPTVTKIHPQLKKTHKQKVQKPEEEKHAEAYL